MLSQHYHGFYLSWNTHQTFILLHHDVSVQVVPILKKLIILFYLNFYGIFTLLFLLKQPYLKNIIRRTSTIRAKARVPMRDCPLPSLIGHYFTSLQEYLHFSILLQSAVFSFFFFLGRVMAAEGSLNLVLATRENFC
jgi:hypothetical protein